MEEKKILEIIAEYTNYSPEQLDEEMNFVDDLGIDSLDLAQIVMSIEDEYGVELEEEVLEGIATVGDALALVKEAE